MNKSTNARIAVTPYFEKVLFGGLTDFATIVLICLECSRLLQVQNRILNFMLSTRLRRKDVVSLGSHESRVFKIRSTTRGKETNTMHANHDIRFRGKAEYGWMVIVCFMFCLSGDCKEMRKLFPLLTEIAKESTNEVLLSYMMKRCA